MTTVKDIINDVITQLSLVGSFSTQVYASPHIQQHVQDAVILMMDEEWWPQLTKYFQATLDGVTGKITTDLTAPGFLNHSVSRYQDIEFVMVADTDWRLRRLPTNINPYNLASSSGQSLYIEPDASNPARPFTVWPITSTDSLVIRAKLYPNIPLGPADTVYLDRLMLTYAAAWMYATDDGTVPGAIDKFEKLLEKRLMQVKKGYENQPIPLNGGDRARNEATIVQVGVWDDAVWSQT